MPNSKKPHPTPQQYGRVVRDLIEESGMKHAAISEQANMSAGTLSSIVNGKLESKKIISRHIDKLCAVLKLDRNEVDRRALHEGKYGLASSKFGMDLGETLTLWSSVIGNGQMVLDIKDVQLRFDDNAEVVLPLSVERLVSRVLKEKAAGKHAFENNQGLTILEASWFPFGGLDERPGVRLTLGKMPYALVYALRHTEQGKRISGELLNEWEPCQEIDPVLARRLGVSVGILSNDGQMIFGRRFSNIGAREEEIDTGSVEGLELTDVVDKDEPGSAHIDIESVMKRAVFEEFGITEPKIESIKILNFGYDIGWAQWNFIGLCQTNLSAKEILSRHKSVAPHGIEYRETYAVKAVPKDVFGWLANEPRGIWSCGLATAFYSMVHLHGIDEVEDATKELSFKISHNLVWN